MDISEVANELHQLLPLFDIDENNLAKMWHEQPMIYTRLCEAAGAARYRSMALKLDIARREAELSLQLRKKGIPGLDKVTEGTISAAITVDEQVNTLKKNHLVSLYKEYVLEGYMEAWRMRERSVKNLTQMWWDANNMGLPPEEREEKLQRLAEERKRQEGQIHTFLHTKLKESQ